MKCISVYTKDFGAFSDVLEEIMTTSFQEDEEKEIEGITVSESGFVPENYIERMKAKPEVVVMKWKDKNVTILQHGDVFEILLPTEESVVN
ncbi:NAD/NADP transhydrogenase alpha subunit [Marinicrinis lubricantis]|uniref:NAD/NADP transhydrogenase alpha subunit n=1 Tax=Marinicrinis lubricantis TaxID=2086470 RepID=A0ABW1ILU0_9BACL